MGNMLTKEVFDKHINTKYRVKCQDNKYIELELIKCERREAAGIEGFALIFKGTADTELNDNTYKFEHDKMGTFDLFISPFWKDDDKLYYDAQFTKIKE